MLACHISLCLLYHYFIIFFISCIFFSYLFSVKLCRRPQGAVSIVSSLICCWRKGWLHSNHKHTHTHTKPGLVEVSILLIRAVFKKEFATSFLFLIFATQCPTLSINCTSKSVRGRNSCSFSKNRRDYIEGRWRQTFQRIINIKPGVCLFTHPRRMNHMS